MDFEVIAFPSGHFWLVGDRSDIDQAEVVSCHAVIDFLRFRIDVLKGCQN